MDVIQGAAKVGSRICAIRGKERFRRGKRMLFPEPPPRILGKTKKGVHANNEM